MKAKLLALLQSVPSKLKSLVSSANVPSAIAGAALAYVLHGPLSLVVSLAAGALKVVAALLHLI